MASSRTGSRTVPFVSVIASAALRSGPGRRILDTDLIDMVCSLERVNHRRNGTP